MGMAKDSKIDAVDEQLNYLANSMNDWEQSEHALSEAAAMLSGIAKNHSGEEDEEKQLESLKRGLDDITASIHRMNAAAREDMADVIEQTQRDNELLEAINVEPIIEGTPQSEYEAGTQSVNRPGAQSEPTTANQVKISKVKPLDDATSGMEIDKIAGLFASSNPVKKVSKVKPLEDATSGMDIDKIAGLHQEQPAKPAKKVTKVKPLEDETSGMDISKIAGLYQEQPAKTAKKVTKVKPLEDETSGMEVDKIAGLYKTSSHKEGKSAKLSKHSKASKPVETDDVFETVVTPESELTGDEFRFVAERELAANPVEWKLDESALQAFSATKETEKQNSTEEQITGAEQVSVSESAEPVSFSSEPDRTPSGGESLSMINLESDIPARAREQSQSLLSGADTAPSGESLSTISFQSDDSPAAEHSVSASFLSEESEASLQPSESILSVPDADEPQPAEMVQEEPSSEPEASAGPTDGLPNADMQISNDMFDLGVDLSDEPDYSDENIDLNVFSGSIEDAEQYNAAPENSVDLDAEYADSGSGQEMDLSNLVAAAMNDLTSRHHEPQPEQTMDSSLPDEEDYHDVPTVSNLESELKKAESEKRRSEGEEVRQQGSAGFAYALNDLNQAAAATETEDAEKRVIAQYLVHKSGEDERSYYRLVFQ